MAVCYKKLWKLLIDKNMKKIDLERKSGITHYALGQLSQGKNVSTEVLGKICEALDCTFARHFDFLPTRRLLRTQPF
ncbi:MAG: helix-turn-helix transcriptional regulator [Clostridia bacterium]|nr:helix-turn-helix transcriptional regulator [Clostridia bacterium]